jgi:hypothetical protein
MAAEMYVLVVHFVHDRGVRGSETRNFPPNQPDCNPEAKTVAQSGLTGVILDLKPLGFR